MKELQNLVKILEQDIYATKDIDNDWFVESAIKSLNNLKEAISVTQCSEELNTFRDRTTENLDSEDIVTQEAVDSYLESI